MQLQILMSLVFEANQKLIRHNCKWVDVKNEHIETVKNYAVGFGSKGFDKNLMDLNIKISFASGTLIADNQCLLVGGLVFSHEKVLNLWAIFNNPLRWKYRRQILYGIKTILDIMLLSNACHRVQYAIASNERYSTTFPEHLGFTFESVMKNYGTDKTDYLMYVRLG